MSKSKKPKSKHTIQFIHDNYNSENVFRDLNSNSSTSKEQGKTYRKTPFKLKRNFIKSESDSLIVEDAELAPSKSEVSIPKKARSVSAKLKFEPKEETIIFEDENSDSNESFSFSKLCSRKSFDLNDSFIDAVPADELFNSSINNLDDSVIKSAKVYESDCAGSENGSLDEESSEEVQINEEVDVKEESNSNSVKNSTIGTYFDLPEGKLVILPSNKEVVFYGVAEIDILYGKIDILGYEFEPASPAIKVYSPKGSAHLTVKNVHENSAKFTSIEYLAPVLQKHEDIRSAQRIRRNSSIFLCRTLEDPQMDFVRQHISQNIVPPQRNGPKIVFEPGNCLNVVKSSSDWYKLVDDFDVDSRVMIVGGKGVGKSTFFRFTINRLLNRFQKVRIIDLDPGQPEFTVPGVISVSTVENPICGPNYTHLSTPDCAFLCNINVGHNPQLYLKIVNNLMSFSNDQVPHLPTIINYMGFSHGLGINILASVVHYAQPTNIVEIQSHNQTKNFKYPLDVPTLEEMAALFVDRKSLNINAFTLHQMKSMKQAENVGWRLQSRQIREMCLLAYLGRLGKPILDASVPIYEISLNDINMADLEGHTVPPAVANANIVALSCRSNSDLFQSYGWGIVRGIDTTNGKLYLVTPDAAALDVVNYLIVGVVPLPPSIYMTVEEQGTVPHVMQGELEFLGKITKRSFRPLNNN